MDWIVNNWENIMTVLNTIGLILVAKNEVFLFQKKNSKGFQPV